jgi:hypothetical protein
LKQVGSIRCNKTRKVSFSNSTNSQVENYRSSYSYEKSNSFPALLPQIAEAFGAVAAADFAVVAVVVAAAAAVEIAAVAGAIFAVDVVVDVAADSAAELKVADFDFAATNFFDFA